MRAVYLVAMWIALSLHQEPALAQTTAGQPSVAQIGPSFDCQKVNTPLAKVICADPALSALDLRLNQAYWALLRQVGDDGAKSLRAEDVAFVSDVERLCGFASTVPPTSDPALPACVNGLYERQRELWMSRLSGPAREEASRASARHIALQADLQSLGFLPADTKVDGVYGKATRGAITIWQVSHGHAGTGLLGDADALLLEQDARKPNAETLTRREDKPPTPEAASALPGEGLSVTLTPTPTPTALVIKGAVHNDTGSARSVPRLRVALTDASDTEIAMKVIGPPVATLEGGASAEFAVMFDPDPEATGAAVSFFASQPHHSGRVK